MGSRAYTTQSFYLYDAESIVDPRTTSTSFGLPSQVNEVSDLTKVGDIYPAYYLPLIKSLPCVTNIVRSAC